MQEIKKLKTETEKKELIQRCGKFDIVYTSDGKSYMYKCARCGALFDDCLIRPVIWIKPTCAERIRNLLFCAIELDINSWLHKHAIGLDIALTIIQEIYKNKTE